MLGAHLVTVKTAAGSTERAEQACQVILRVKIFDTTKKGVDDVHTVYLTETRRISEPDSVQ